MLRHDDPDRPSASSLGRTTTTEALVAELRRQILDGDVSPGQPLREAEIATRFRVGRNTVRAALQALTHEGILLHESHRGAFVREYSLGDIQSVYGMRTALEVEAARVIVAERIDLPDAADAVERLESAPDSTPWSELLALDMTFHQAVIYAIGNRRMATAFDSLIHEVRLLQAQVHSAYRQQPAATLGNQHRCVLEALVSGDLDRAVSSVREHLEHSRREVTQSLRRKVQPGTWPAGRPI